MRPNVIRSLSKYVYDCSKMFCAASFITPFFSVKEVGISVQFVFALVALGFVLFAIVLENRAEDKDAKSHAKKKNR